MRKNSNELKIYGLTCNYSDSPLGVETESPSFAWKLKAAKGPQFQTAYRVLVSGGRDGLDMDTGDMWDSGKVISGYSVCIEYKGRKLESGKRYYWKVMIWDSEDHESRWSEPAYFEMGLLSREDWKAKWISYPYQYFDVKQEMPAPLLRKSFMLSKKVVDARLYISGLGFYTLHVNGLKADDSVLNPPFTRYDETVLYRTYDITGMLCEGENVFGVTLGNGMYNCMNNMVWNTENTPWRHHPKMILQAVIQYEDGEKLEILSDSTWRVAAGPIRYNSLYDGEIYDARQEMDGWDRAGFNDEGWLKASICRSPGGILKSMQMQPCKVVEEIKPKTLWNVNQNVCVYDMGINMTGWVRLRVSGAAGTEVTVKYGERLGPERDIDRSNINMHVKSERFQTDTYILKGKGDEVWEPGFTYHGFQYVQISGYPGIAEIDSIVGCRVNTAFDGVGQFECSNPLLNKIQSACRLSSLGNYLGIPTDCPHREKNGWTGDALLSAEQLMLNFNPLKAYAKWMKDFKDCQRPNGQLPGIVPTGGWGYNWGSGPAWDSAIVLIPWYMYLYRGDKAILEEMYDSMKSYVDFMSSMTDGYIADFGLGDWCPPGGINAGYKCPSAVTDTAYFHEDSRILSKIAMILGKTDDEIKYGRLADNIRRAFLQNFVNAETGEVAGNSQTSYACALFFGLAEGETREKVIGNLVKEVERCGRHIDCGILGAKYVLHALTEAGRADLAYEIATQTTFPGWGHWIEQGATTLWETWAGDWSLNHHMFSDISAWFYKGLAGINPDPEMPGFKHILLRPNPVEGLMWVKASHESMYGRIECNWRIEDGTLYIEASIPDNCTASLYLPEKYKAGAEIKSLGCITIIE